MRKGVKVALVAVGAIVVLMVAASAAAPRSSSPTAPSGGGSASSSSYAIVIESTGSWSGSIQVGEFSQRSIDGFGDHTETFSCAPGQIYSASIQTQGTSPTLTMKAVNGQQQVLSEQSTTGDYGMVTVSGTC
jgi:hypothetical protein